MAEYKLLLVPFPLEGRDPLSVCVEMSHPFLPLLSCFRSYGNPSVFLRSSETRVPYCSLFSRVILALHQFVHR